jgi:hypothetical protein
MKPFLRDCLSWFGAGFGLGALAAPLLLAAWLAYYGWVPAAISFYSGSPFAIISNPQVEILGKPIPVTVPTMFVLTALAGGLGGSVVALAVGCLLRFAFRRHSSS